MALIDNLVSYYKMDETSGIRYDAVGSVNLSEIGGTVGYIAGKNGNAANLTSDAVRLDGGNNHYYTDITISFWMNVTTVASCWYMGKYALPGLSAQSSWVFWSNEGLLYWLIAHSNSSAITQVEVAHTTGAWVHYVASYNGTSKAMKMYKNYSTTDTNTCGGAMNNGTQNFQLNSYENHCNGAIGEVGIWNRVLSDAEVESLYKNGRGNFYDNAVENDFDNAYGRAPIFKITNRGME